MSQQYVVVEHAGTDQEHIVTAGSWTHVVEMEKTYTIDEIEQCGVRIMAVIGDLDGDYVLTTEY